MANEKPEWGGVGRGGGLKWRSEGEGEKVETLSLRKTRGKKMKTQTFRCGLISIKSHFLIVC